MLNKPKEKKKFGVYDTGFAKKSPKFEGLFTSKKKKKLTEAEKFKQIMKNDKKKKALLAGKKLGGMKGGLSTTTKSIY
tara:strand:+ start:141 stop:374 length:234 start_codon:yes stop_codon:yes gene_type:complete